MKKNLLLACISILLFVLGTPSIAPAKVFKNAYINFEMQDNWDCLLEITEWVCRSKDPVEAKEAVIVITAKEKGPTDSFDIYKDHMSKSIVNSSKGGVTLTSTLKYAAQEQKINNHIWLDALHQDSEVANYFTRYLATIHKEIAMLVTFSAHNRFYAKHSPNFDITIRSLKVLSGDRLLDKGLGPNGAQGDQYGSSEFSDANIGQLANEEETFASMLMRFVSDTFVLGIIFMVLSLGAYFGLTYYLKKKQKKKEDKAS